MYTHDDYLRDLYIREHGKGYEQSMADLRARDYEHGRDPELRYTSEGREILKEQSKQDWFGFIGAILGTIIPVTIGIFVGIYLGSITAGFIAWIILFFICIAIYDKTD